MAQLTTTDILKATGLTREYEGRIMEILKNSPQYQSKITNSLLKGTVVEGDPAEIAVYIKSQIGNEEFTEMTSSKPKYSEESAEERAVRFKKEGIIYELQGNRGRSMKVFEDRCWINVEPTVGAVITGNATDGEKTIFYKDCVGIQFKESKLAIGYLQIETSSGYGNNGNNNFFNENTFTFEGGAAGQPTNEKMREVANYIIARVARFKQFDPGFSPADEIRKYKELLDTGAITAEEYESKKRKLLML